MMIFSLIITIATIAICAVLANAADKEAKSSKKKGKSAFKFEGGAWFSNNEDGSSTYMKFNDMYTFERVIGDASGVATCNKAIYDLRHKNKNPSIFIDTYYGDFARSSLIYKSATNGNTFTQVLISSGKNITWTRVGAIPSDVKCFTASIDMIAEESIQIYYRSLTWMGPAIGLYTSVRSDNNNNNHLTVVSEVDGFTLTDKSSFLNQGQYNNFQYVQASFNGTYWARSGSSTPQLLQSNSPPPFDVGFAGNGAAALSETILFLIDKQNGRLVKYDVVNKVILLSVDTQARDDLAISLDGKYLYYVNNEDGNMIVALNTADLSFYRGYRIALPTDSDFSYGIEITPTHFWIMVHNGEDGHRLASISLSDN